MLHRKHHTESISPGTMNPPASATDRAGRAPGTRDLHVVYCWCMSRVRTNIEIEDTDVRAIMDRFGVRTKTEAVALALRHLAGQPMTREEALAMRGANAIEKIPADVALPAEA